MSEVSRDQHSWLEILFKILLFKGGVLIYAEHCRTKAVS